MGEIRLFRVYDREPPGPGKTFLVERLWPRGVRREELALDGWCKDAAPSTELRKWFGHDPARWAEFRRRYTAELDARPEAWRPLADAVSAGDVNLVYSSRDREHNNAVVLRDYVVAHTREG
ncbi:MAG TPA: DUF488 family protein [Mycobacteriales bacterium]|nr:DUF488 family protein [Mycobacteriales bacterium]